jgi:hypothetical protein
VTPGELSDALDGLYAYDIGCVSSGIHDEMLRERVKAELKTVDLLWLSHWVREQYLSDEALKQGYRLEDVARFIKWLRDDMDYDV